MTWPKRLSIGSAIILVVEFLPRLFGVYVISPPRGVWRETQVSAALRDLGWVDVAYELDVSNSYTFIPAVILLFLAFSILIFSKLRSFAK